MSIELQEDLAPEAAALQELAGELVEAALATRRSEALLVRAQASLLAWLSVGERSAQGGYSRLSDLVLITIGMSARTVRDRLRLHRLFQYLPGLEVAFIQGKVSLCQIGAAAPIFQAIEPGDAESATRWIDIAGWVTVRAMQREVRHQKRKGLLKAEPEAEGQRVSFRAPVGFRVAWDEGIDLARRQIGGDAPVHECVAAILAESGFAGLGPKQRQSTFPRERGIGVRPRRLVPHNPDAIARARKTLRQTFAAIKDVKELVGSGEPRSVHEAIEALRQIERLRAPHQVLFCHLIRDLRATYAMDLLGYRSMAELVEDLFGLSERSARNRVAESLLFESSREIETAFGRGDISLMQAHLIKKIAAGARVDPFIDRARDVTWRQLQREARILDLLRKCGLGRVSRGPLPDSRVEEALIEALGGDAEAIEGRLRERGLPPLPADGSSDPAENCILMERIEALVEMAVLALWDEIPDTIAGKERQMFAASPQETAISFWAPDSVAHDFLHAVAKIRLRVRPHLASWMAVVQILSDAEEAWLRHDPKRRPGGARVFERDNYRCIVPGCSSRSHLEDHHNEFLSQGGSDELDNRSTLCHGHHRRGVHRGRIRISGPARHRLRFEIGCRPDGPPILVLDGEKIVRSAFVPSWFGVLSSRPGKGGVEP